MARFHLLAAGVLLASSALLFQACSADVAEGGSNSNWLSPCETDADCDGSACLCGLCTRSCADTEDCGEGGGECLAPGDPRAGGRCSGEDVAGVCLLTCLTEADCESVDTGLSCDDGVCIRGPATHPPEGGSPSVLSPDGGSPSESSPDASLADPPDAGSIPPPDASLTDEGGQGPTNAPDATAVVKEDVRPIPDPGSPLLPGPDLGEACASADPLLRPDSGELAPDWCREPYVCLSGTCSDTPLCSSGYVGECIVADAAGDGYARGDGGATALGDIEADDDYVYWVKPSSIDPFRNYIDDGAVLRKPITGGPTEAIASNLRGPTELLLTPTHVFYVAAVNPAVSLSDTRMWRVALDADSGAAEAVFDGLSLTLNERYTITDGTHLYWSSGYAIRRVPVDGNEVEEVIASTGSSGGLFLTQDAERVYWTGSDGIFWTPKQADAGSGGMLPLSRVPWSIVKVPGAILGLTGSEVLSIDESTGLVSSLGRFSNVDWLMLRGNYLYARRWGDPEGIARLQYAPPGELEYVALTPDISDLAVSDAGVFWPQDGQIRAVLGP